jgi:uncharacterized protein with GYD domain
MPTYVTLMNWTDQGIRNVRDSVERYDRSTELADKHGVSLEQIYWTVGPHDLEHLATKLGCTASWKDECLLRRPA